MRLWVDELSRVPIRKIRLCVPTLFTNDTRYIAFRREVFPDAVAAKFPQKVAPTACCQLENTLSRTYRHFAYHYVVKIHRSILYFNNKRQQSVQAALATSASAERRQTCIYVKKMAGGHNRI